MQATERDGGRHRPFLQEPIWLEQGGRLAHAGLVMTLSLFIMFGPAAGQIFGRHYGFLREWIMFSGSGIGVLKGRFVLHRAEKPDQEMTPLEMLGLRTYPDASPDEFGRLVFNVGGLRRIGAPVCDRQTEVTRLSYKGWVGTRQGWRALEVADICALPTPSAGDEVEDPAL